MSEEQTQETSSEDKFFGVKTQIGKKSEPAPVEEASDIEVRVVDDTPPEDRNRPSFSNDTPADDGITEEELKSYTGSAQKRINKLRAINNDDRRKREQAEKMRDEAVRVAQELVEKNKNYQSMIDRGESALLDSVKQKAKVDYESAKQNYKTAYEEGDTEKILATQEAMNLAHYELKEVEKKEQGRQFAQKAREVQAKYQPQQPVQQPAPQPQQLSQKQISWKENNPWFMHDDHKDMTALAYGVHEKLIRDERLDPNSDEYYNRIDATMRQKFPEYFGEDARSGSEAPSAPSRANVVAPANRNNGAKPRTVELTPSQVALAKRLGLTNEQYARQLMKG